MFEQLDEPQKKPHVSTAMTLGILAAYLVGAFGGFCLFIILSDRPFGIQIATAITYTYFAFWYVFSRREGYSKNIACETRQSERSRGCSPSTVLF